VLAAFIVRIVDTSRRLAWLIAGTALLITIVLGWFAAEHFKINTDVNQLLSADLPWRQREVELEKAFPQKVDVLLVVIDGENPDAAENAAAALAAKLGAMPDKFSYVERPDAIPFFRKNGLLFLSKEELSDTLNGLARAQPLLGTMAADPSLRGLFTAFDLELQGLAQGAIDYTQLDKPFGAVASTIEGSLAGHDKPFGWQALMSKPQPRDLRKLIVTKPVLNYDALEPGKDASDAIRALAQQMNLTPDHGVHIRLTGSVPLNDEEFASVANGTSYATLASALLVVVILLLALRSLRLVIPILLTLTAGLIATTAAALATIGSLNLISVAFAVMFIGIAVDFGIQFGVRYRDQHHREPDHAEAMRRTARIIAAPLSMAAASTSLGFLAFIPTEYRGVSELGFIAGIGMIIAFTMSITLLPALLSLFHPPAEPESIGFTWAARGDHFIARHRRKIIVAALAMAVIGGLAASQLRFDFDPIDLKDPHTESVSTLFDLMKDPDFSIYDVDALRPTLKDAEDLAAKMQALPEVDHVLTLASFVPDDQDNKLVAISDTRTLLEPTLNPPATIPTPNDQQILDSFVKISAKLHVIGAQHESAVRLAAALDAVIAHPDHDLLERLHTDLVSGMQNLLVEIRQSLQAEHVTIDNIGDDLRQDWITADGRAKVAAYPKGDARDHRILIAFTDATRQIAPDATGAPISIRESGHTVTNAFIHAGCYALGAIALLAFLILRRARDVVFLLAPLVLAGILTMATMALSGLPLNFANIIALPLLLSLGVSYAVYFVSYWRDGGGTFMLQSSMARAVLFSAATTLIAFGTLGFSLHPGTADMGKLLTVALLYSLTCTFFVLPALLGPSEADNNKNETIHAPRPE